MRGGGGYNAANVLFLFLRDSTIYYAFKLQILVKLQLIIFCLYLLMVKLCVVCGGNLNPWDAYWLNSSNQSLTTNIVLNLLVLKLMSNASITNTNTNTIRAFWYTNINRNMNNCRRQELLNYLCRKIYLRRSILQFIYKT